MLLAYVKHIFQAYLFNARLYDLLQFTLNSESKRLKV